MTNLSMVLKQKEGIISTSLLAQMGSFIELQNKTSNQFWFRLNNGETLMEIQLQISLHTFDLLYCHQTREGKMQNVNLTDIKTLAVIINKHLLSKE